jgi:hypothetical protein
MRIPSWRNSNFAGAIEVLSMALSIQDYATHPVRGAGKINEKCLKTLVSGLDVTLDPRFDGHDSIVESQIIWSARRNFLHHISQPSA